MQVRWTSPLWVALTLVACSDSGGSQTETADSHPYKPGETSVIGQGDTPKEYTNPTGAGCLKDEKGACVDLGKECAPTDKVDVVVDKNGQVVDVICYPTGSAPVSSAEEKPPTGRTYANNEVVVLDDKDDGADVEGNVDVDSNNVTIWGNGPEVSVIDGNVTVSKNNGVVRGVRIKGNVTLSGNNASLLLCVVEGDVTITGNNNVLASCDVYGKVIISGQNDAVVSNRIAGDVSNKGSGLICSENLVLIDKDGDKVFDPGEAGAALTCEGSKGK